MKIITPVDYWQAGVQVWVAAWTAQVAFGERWLAAMAGLPAASASLPKKSTRR